MAIYTRSITFSLIATLFAAATVLLVTADSADARSGGGGSGAGKSLGSKASTGGASTSMKPRLDKNGNVIKPPCSGSIIIASARLTRPDPARGRALSANATASGGESSRRLGRTHPS